MDEKIKRYENIVCEDECFICKIGWNGEDRIEIYRCVINLCENHLKEITKGCIAPRNILCEASREAKDFAASRATGEYFTRAQTKRNES